MSIVLVASVAEANSGFGQPARCAWQAWPHPAVAGSELGVKAWTSSELPRDGVVPQCLGWKLPEGTSFAFVTGTFQAAGLDAVLGRIGAISGFEGLRYWSVTDNRLEALIMHAFAGEGGESSKVRADFSPAEMQVGRDLFFTEQDNRSSIQVLYKMRVIEREANGLVIDITNASKVRLLMLTVFEPGDLHTALFISRSSEGTWICYAVSAFRPTTLTKLFDNPKSRINRLLAFYGHIAVSNETDLPWAK